LTVQYMAKKVSPVICGDTKVPLNGIPQVQKTKFRSLASRRRTVSRAYGGSLSHEAVEFRIKRAFFNEEIKQMKNATTSRKAKKGRGKK